MREKKRDKPRVRSQAATSQPGEAVFESKIYRRKEKKRKEKCK